jgi:acetyl-CoA synthetase
MRYIDTYWRRFPAAWVLGDWASYDRDGYWFLHGRSDDTLNIAGQRSGPVEVEEVLSDHPAVSEAAAIAVRHEVTGEAIWCFVVPAVGAECPDGNDLAEVVASRLGKPFRLERVFVVSDLPRTRSAKILRRVVRAAALEKDVGDLSSIENRTAINGIREAVK